MNPTDKDRARSRIACIVYVHATANLRGPIKKRLEAEGYEVREIKASIDDALAAQAGVDVALPAELTRLIEESDLCVFLLPEVGGDDGFIDAVAGLANKLNKPVIGVVAGKRENYPPNLDDCAKAMVREGSSRISDALKGQEIWEKPDGSIPPDRTIKHIKCQ
jgi:hypothetical protein